MKFPWRSRIALGVAAGAAAVIVPLTAPAASAATSPYGPGWVLVGGENFSGGYWQCIDEMTAWVKQTPKYDMVGCNADPQPGMPNFYDEWMHLAK
ncbi:hypothetical protein ACIPRD_07980 [Streptomyces sp. NPDC090108]|uniref:hypothetical protein n=1 Tax=Streptomyces sp. NPDC090108 TaxID=3365947 RepID=UPI0038281F3F